MLRSNNPFGQSSNSAFGSTSSVFGQISNTSNNPYATKPFGSMSSFGSQTGSSTPDFGASSSSIGGSSVFGQKITVGDFGSNTQSTSCGSSLQKLQPAFGSNIFGCSSLEASSHPALGDPSTPAFEASITPAFGATSTCASLATSTPAFGPTTTPAFGATSVPDFGAKCTPASGYTPTPTFGMIGSAYGISSTSVFGSSTPAFGASSTSAFGASGTPAFGASSTPAFGSTPATSFSFWSSPAFGQSTSAYQSSPFGSTSTSFGAQSSGFGVQTTTSAFGSPWFGQPSFGGQQRGGTRVTPYAQTPEADSGTRIDSISAMPAYKEKSHEELRLEDYQLGDKGSLNSAAQSSGGMGFYMNNTQQTNPFSSSSPAFWQPSASPFSSTTSTNLSVPKTSTFVTPWFGSSTPSLGSSPFGAAASNPFGSTPSPASLVFGQAPSAFGQTVPSCRQSTSTFGQSNAFGGNFFPSTPSLLSISIMRFNQTSPSLSMNLLSIQPTQGGFGFGFGSSTPAFGASSTPASGASSTPAFGASSTPVPVASSTPADGSSPAPVFCATSSPFSFSSSPALGQSSSAYRSRPLSATSSAFGAQRSPFEGQTTAPAFGSPGFGQPSFGGQQCRGTRVTPYAQTPEADSGSSTQPAIKLDSISAMPAYKEKSHEELRWEDYQLGDKGDPNPACTESAPLFQSTAPTLGQTSSPFGQFAPSFRQSTPTFGQLNAFEGNMFSTAPSLLSTSNMGFNQTTPSLSMPFQSVQPTLNTPGFGFGAPAGGIGGTTSIIGQNNFGEPFASRSPALAQPQSITNPFGTLPAISQISIGRMGNAPSLQHGITSLQIVVNGLFSLSINNV